MSSPLDMSQTTYGSSMPSSSRISADACRRFASSREESITWQPSFARARAIALPMPLLAPPTNAARPVSPRSISDRPESLSAYPAQEEPEKQNAWPDRDYAHADKIN